MPKTCFERKIPPGTFVSHLVCCQDVANNPGRQSWIPTATPGPVLSPRTIASPKDRRSSAQPPTHSGASYFTITDTLRAKNRPPFSAVNRLNNSRRKARRRLPRFMDLAAPAYPLLTRPSFQPRVPLLHFSQDKPVLGRNTGGRHITWLGLTF